MRFSLRTLIVVMLLGGPILAGFVWQFMPHPADSPADIARFLKVVKQPYDRRIWRATERCFVVGAPATQYQKVLAAADAIGPPDPNLTGFTTGTQYRFWCGGKEPSEGQPEVIFVVDGKPAEVVFAKVISYLN